MFDAVEPIVIPVPSEGEGEGGTFGCPGCGTAFTPKRSNQSYCSRGCQKNASRGNRSAENKQRSRWHYERLRRNGWG